MEDDRVKWNDRYRGRGFFLGPQPSQFLAERIASVVSLSPGKRALDIACGEGRNSIFLARHGFSVTGVDIAETGLEKGRRWARREGLVIDFRCVDLEEGGLTGTYDLIINFNFLLRRLIPEMIASLSPGGLIVFDTILDSPSAPLPHRTEFLLQPGELSRIFAGYAGEILHYEEFPLDASPTAKLIFRKGREVLP
jgi:tellurite methyltransferase